MHGLFRVCKAASAAACRAEICLRLGNESRDWAVLEKIKRFPVGPVFPRVVARAAGRARYQGMCGIAGAFGGLSGPEMSEAARGIVKEMSYRGPDGHGVDYFDDGFLLHLRLAIIDLSEGGRQPRWSDDGRICLTFNGEIYNYVELRDELQAQGCGFHTDSDSEVLVKLWETQGIEGLARCIGMYAFAILDTVERRLYLARDPYGIKPLYVVDAPGGLRFASNHAALTRFLDCPNKIEARAAFGYVRYGTIERGGATLVGGIRSLRPGTVEIWDLANSRPKKILTKPVPVCDHGIAAPGLSFAEAAAELRDRFLRSVRLHLRSDAPLGFALSGGLDSSAIVCASRLLEPSAPLRTFTYSAEGHPIDERRWAESVAMHVSAESRHVTVSSDSAIRILEETVRCLGPSPGAGTVAQKSVFRIAREAGIKVMLDGQGADEIFGGYHFHIGAALAGYIKRGDYVDALRLMRASAGIPAFGTGMCVAFALDHLLPSSIQALARAVGGRTRCPDWINKRWLVERAPDFLESTGIQASRFGRDVLADRLQYDLNDAILPELLHYEDRNAMYHSIESRVPFLSSSITGFAFSLPSSFHIGPDGQTKRLFREAMRGIVPDEIRLRKDKIGIATPQASWLFRERDRIERLLDSDVARSIALFDHDALMAHWRAIDGPDHRDLIFVWRWVSLILWTRSFQIDWS